MFAVLGRLNPSYEEAAYDLGASKWQTVKQVVVPIVLPRHDRGRAVRLHALL